MAEKLGPNVTFNDYNKEGTKSVSIEGVLLEDGKSVNLVEALGEARAQPLLKKLAGNPSFKVDGGPDHQAEAKKKQQFEQQQAERRQQLQDEASKKTQDEERAKSEEQTKKAEEAAQAYKGPDQPTLESDTKSSSKTSAKKPGTPTFE